MHKVPGEPVYRSGSTLVLSPGDRSQLGCRIRKHKSQYRLHLIRPPGDRWVRYRAGYQLIHGREKDGGANGSNAAKTIVVQHVAWSSCHQMAQPRKYFILRNCAHCTYNWWVRDQHHCHQDSKSSVAQQANTNFTSCPSSASCCPSYASHPSSTSRLVSEALSNV